MSLRNKKREARAYFYKCAGYNAKYTFMYGSFCKSVYTICRKKKRAWDCGAVGAHHQPTLFAYTHILLPPILVYRMAHLFPLPSL